MTQQTNNKYITGIHHITALADDAQRNIDFYPGILGLRMIKKTVNFDDPGVYHLYYGDETGTPGSILTFFPYAGIGEGRKGNGLVNTTTFSVPYDAIGYWENRFKQYGVAYKPVQERFEGEPYLYFEDPDGLPLELVFTEQDNRQPFTYGHVPLDYAIRGFFSAELWVSDQGPTAALLTDVLGHQLVAEADGRYRFAASQMPGKYIDLRVSPAAGPGINGSGTIHHIAFSTPDQSTQLKVREAVQSFGMRPTPVIDRQYFRSVYFREPSGVLFEVATEGPGFAIDEPMAALGEELKLPPQYEERRDQIEKMLDPVEINLNAYQ